MVGRYHGREGPSQLLRAGGPSWTRAVHEAGHLPSVDDRCARVEPVHRCAGRIVLWNGDREPVDPSLALHEGRMRSSWREACLVAAGAASAAYAPATASIDTQGHPAALDAVAAGDAAAAGPLRVDQPRVSGCRSLANSGEIGAGWPVRGPPSAFAVVTGRSGAGLAPAAEDG
eukprot:scaffold5292_cov113-Isochrysis_galbana.AAC.12